MRLITQFTKKKNVDYNELTYDIFIIGNDCELNSSIFEVKLFNLVGLYYGEIGRWEKHLDHNSLDRLDKQLQEETERALFRKNYFYWCKTDYKYKSIKVGSIIESGFEQLCMYIKTINNGKASNSFGISDNRIRISNGTSLIKGYLIAVFEIQILNHVRNAHMI